MKYIALAAHKNELIVITDMDTFTLYFCYSKKQRHSQVLTASTEDLGDAEPSILLNEIEEIEIEDEDDL